MKTSHKVMIGCGGVMLIMIVFFGTMFGIGVTNGMAKTITQNLPPSTLPAPPPAPSV